MSNKLKPIKEMGKKAGKMIAKGLTYPFIMPTALRRELKSGSINENDINDSEGNGLINLCILNGISYVGFFCHGIDTKNPYTLAYSIIGASTNIASGLYELHKHRSSRLEKAVN